MSDSDGDSSFVEKAIGAFVTPIRGAVALAKAVVGGDDNSRERAERGRPDEGVEIPRPSGPDEPESDPTSTPSVEPTFDSEPDDTEESESVESTTADEETDEAEETEEEAPELVDIWGVGDSRAEDLREIGLETVSDVAGASVEELAEISGVGETTARKMIDSAEELQ